METKVALAYPFAEFILHFGEDAVWWVSSFFWIHEYQVSLDWLNYSYFLLWRNSKSGHILPSPRRAHALTRAHTHNNKSRCPTWPLLTSSNTALYKTTPHFLPGSLWDPLCYLHPLTTWHAAYAESSPIPPSQSPHWPLLTCGPSPPTPHKTLTDLAPAFLSDIILYHSTSPTLASWIFLEPPSSTSASVPPCLLFCQPKTHLQQIPTWLAPSLHASMCSNAASSEKPSLIPRSKRPPSKKIKYHPQPPSSLHLDFCSITPSVHNIMLSIYLSFPYIICKNVLAGGKELGKWNLVLTPIDRACPSGENTTKRRENTGGQTTQKNVVKQMCR